MYRGRGRPCTSWAPVRILFNPNSHQGGKPASLSWASILTRENASFPAMPRCGSEPRPCEAPARPRSARAPGSAAAPGPPSRRLPEDRYHPVNAALDFPAVMWQSARLFILSMSHAPCPASSPAPLRNSAPRARANPGHGQGGSAFLHERIPKVARANPATTGIPNEPGKRGSGEISRTNSTRAHPNPSAGAHRGLARCLGADEGQLPNEPRKCPAINGLAFRIARRYCAVPRPLPVLSAAGHGRPRPRGGRSAAGQAGEAS